MDLVEAVRDQLETHTEATLDAPLSFESVVGLHLCLGFRGLLGVRG